MNRMMVEQRADHNFLRLEKEEWLTAAEFNGSDGEKQKKILKTFNVDEIKKKKKKWKKNTDGGRDLELEVEKKWFDDELVGKLEKYGIPLRDTTIKVSSTPPKKSFKDFTTELQHPSNDLLLSFSFLSTWLDCYASSSCSCSCSCYCCVETWCSIAQQSSLPACTGFESGMSLFQTQLINLYHFCSSSASFPSAILSAISFQELSICSLVFFPTL